jgi:ribulose-5-phosphate 4-epimerase/fuculose-1-phosphate aldolase
MSVQRLVADLGDKFVMVLRNHGMLTCGRSVAEAFKLMHNLERSCRAQLAVQSSGAEIIELSAAVGPQDGRPIRQLLRRDRNQWRARQRMGRLQADA